jgi:hypothetical protein
MTQTVPRFKYTYCAELNHCNNKIKVICHGSREEGVGGVEFSSTCI